MTSGIRTIVYPAQDIEAAKKLFTNLIGAEPYVDQPYYVGFRVGDQEIGLDPNGHKEGMTAYWQVDDIQKHFDQLVETGAETLQPINDVGEGRLVASVRDPNGNIIGLLQDP